MALLEILDLHASYGAIKALCGISFAVEQGQVVSLIGANGAGKSTTLNTISGLLKPTQGHVVFDGYEITGWRADRVTALGLIQVPEGRQVIAEFVEVEIGEADALHRRPQLAAAVVVARKHRATVAVCKLDSLSSDAHFVSGLMAY